MAALGSVGLWRCSVRRRRRGTGGRGHLVPWIAALSFFFSSSSRSPQGGVDSVLAGCLRRVSHHSHSFQGRPAGPEEGSTAAAAVRRGVDFGSGSRLLSWRESVPSQGHGGEHCSELSHCPSGGSSHAFGIAVFPGALAQSAGTYGFVSIPFYIVGHGRWFILLSTVCRKDTRFDLSDDTICSK